MWADRFKPLHMRDVIIDDDVRRKLNGFIQTKNIPNMIVTGITGIGKSALIDCLARDFYKDNYDTYVYKVNSSLEKNIKLLQEMLETFCKKKLDENQIQRKMFIIDDIDNIPSKLQSIIALMMEKYTNIYFTFTCSNTTDIIEIIQSRCIILHIQRPTHDQIITHLGLICKHGKYKYTNDALERIYFISQGDVRLAINNLQVICDGFGDVTLENLDKICDAPNIVRLRNLIDMCIARKYRDSIMEITQLCNEGYYCSDILGVMFDILKATDCNIPDNIKISYLKIIGKTRYLVNKKIDSFVQLERCIIKLCNILSNNEKN